MTTFHGGPANGITLWLKGSPALLRVVKHPRKGWDALDQRGDLPDFDDEVFVYILRSIHGKICVRPGGCFPHADYDYYAIQPDDATVRGIGSWRAWVYNEGQRKATQA